MKKLLYATTNIGKIKELRRMAKQYEVEILDPISLGIKVEIAESGKTLAENAQKKAEGYLPFVDKDTSIIGDDTGLEIAALGGEPGIYVRRWKDHIHELSDEEIIQYCLTRLDGVPVGKRQAQFHTVLAVARYGDPTTIFNGYLKGEIAIEPIPLRDPGMPFHSLLFLPQYGKMLGEILGVYPTHRDLAFAKAISYLATQEN